MTHRTQAALKRPPRLGYVCYPQKLWITLWAELGWLGQTPIWRGVAADRWVFVHPINSL